MLTPAKWRLRNDCKNSLLMICHYPGLSSASDWSKQISLARRTIRIITSIIPRSETDDYSEQWMCQSTMLGARWTSLCKLHLKQIVLGLTCVPAGAGVCNLYKGLLIASLLYLGRHSQGSYHTFSYCLLPVQKVIKHTGSHYNLLVQVPGTGYQT